MYVYLIGKLKMIHVEELISEGKKKRKSNKKKGPRTDP